jgi:hypothetical protein
MTVMNTPESNINAKDLALSDHQSLACKRCLHVKSSFTKSTYKKKKKIIKMIVLHFILFNRDSQRLKQRVKIHKTSFDNFVRFFI